MRKSNAPLPGSRKPLLVKELEVITYPKRGSWRAKVTADPTWAQIESSIQKLDRHAHPFLNLDLARPKGNVKLWRLNVVGGLGEYGILTFDAKMNQRKQYCDPQRPNGPELIKIWTSDQGAAFEERYLCDDIDLLLRIVRTFASKGKLDPGVEWENWPPADSED